MADENSVLFDIQSGDFEPIVSGIEDIDKGLKDVRGTMRDMKRDGSLVSAFESKPGDFDRISQGIDKTFDGFRTGQKAVSDAAKKIANARKELEGLQKSQDSASSPEQWQDYEAQIDKIANTTIPDLEAALKAVREESGVLFTGDEVLDYMKSTGKAMKVVGNFRKEEAQLSIEIEAQKEQLKEIEEAYNAAYDTGLLVELKDKYDEIEQAMKRNQGLLKDRRDLRSSTLSGGLRGVSTAPGGIGQGAEKAGAYLKTASSLLEQLGVISDKQNDYNKRLDDQGHILYTTSDRIHNFTNGVLTALEQLQTTSSQVEGLQGTMTGWGEQLSNTSGLIAERNKQLLDSGKQLTRVNKLQGKYGQVIGKAGDFAGTATKAIGFLGAGLEGLQLGFSLMDAVTGRSAEAIQERIDAIDREIEKNQEIRDLIESGDIDTANREIESIKKEIAARKERLDALEEEAVANTSWLDMTRTVTEALFVGAENATAYGQSADEMRKTNEEVDELQRQLDKLSDEGLQRAIQATKDWRDTLEEGQRIMDDAKGMQDDFIRDQVDIFDKQNQLQKDLADTDIEAQKEAESRLADRRKEEYSRLEDHLNEMTRLETAHQDEIRSERIDHLKELEDLELNYYKDVKDTQEAFDKELKDFDTSYYDDLIKSEKEYRLNEIDENEKHQKTLAKMEEDYAKDQIKRKKDLENALWEAELDNDALSFFKLQHDYDRESAEQAKQHKEDISEENKNYQEEKDQRAKEHKDKLAEDKLLYEDERAQKLDAHKQDLADLHQKFNDEMALSKQQFQERLKDLEYQYQQERGQQAKAFDARTKELEKEYAEQERMETENLAQKRQTLIDGFQSELDYFAQREAVLDKYTSALQQAGDEFKVVSDAVGRGYFQSGGAQDNKKYTNLLGGRIEELQGKGKYISDDEKKELDSLQRALDEFNRTGITWFRPEEKDLIQSLVDGSIAQKLKPIEQEYDLILKYPDEDTRKFVQSLQDGSIPVTSQFLGGKTSEYLQQTGVDFVEGLGAVTADELANYQRDGRRLQETEGKKTLGQLQGIVQTQNQLAIEGADTWYNANRQAEDDDLNAREQHFYDQTKQTRDWGYQSNQIFGGYYDDYLSEQQQNLDAAGNRQSSYYTDEELLQSDFHDSQYTANEDFNKELSDQAVTFNEDEINRNVELNDTRGQLDDEYRQDFSTNTKQANRDLLRDVAREYSRGANDVVRVHEQIVDAMVKVAQNGLKQVDSLISQMGKYGKYSSYGGGSSSGYGGSSGSKSSLFSGGAYKATLAAKGAFIDRLTVAGEGDEPEVVMPLDKSKGIPDDILGKMGSSFLNGLEDLRPPSGLKETVPNSNQDMLRALTGVMQNMKPSLGLNIQSINVGSDVTIEQVQTQFEDLYDALADVLRQATG